MKVCLLVAMRIESTRIHRKLMQPCGCVPLVRRGLSRLTEAAAAEGVPVFGWVRDAELIAECRRAGLTVLHRPAFTVEGEDYRQVFYGCADQLAALGYTHVLECNAPTRPFVKTATWRKIIRAGLCLDPIPGYPFVAAERQRLILWEAGSRQPVQPVQFSNTKTNPEWLSVADLVYACEVGDLGRPEAADKYKPWEVSLTSLERIDVDTWEDMAIADAIAHREDRAEAAILTYMGVK